MTMPRGQGAREVIPSPQRQAFRGGTLLIIGVGVFLLVGWIFYRQTLPPAWLHDFSEAVALHASADPNRPTPEDIRQISPRVEVDNPYICVGRVIDLSWDRIFAVTSDQDLRAHPVLPRAVWPDQPLSSYAGMLARDDRYQLLVLVDGNDVVDAQLYFTFWGDLTDIARAEGFARDQAVFTAASRGGIYVVSPALNAPVAACA